MTIEEFRKTTLSTETMNDLTAVYLDRLEKGECEPGDQRTAAVVLGEAIRRAQNTILAQRKTIDILANGLEAERKG